MAVIKNTIKEVDAKIIFEAVAFDKAEVNQDKEGSGYNLFLFKKTGTKKRILLQSSVSVEGLGYLKP